MGRKTELMMENIMDARGDVSLYANIARKSRDDYRTLNDFFAEKLRGSTKLLLAQKLGVSVHTLNNWEKNGIPTLKRAVQIAVALGLDLDETNVFFRKYAGMGTLYPADRVHAGYICTLVYRQELERSFPYMEGETVGEWIDRVWSGDSSFAEEEKGGEAFCGEKRVATELFMEAIMSRDAEAMREMPFRSAGEKACRYLQEYVKGGPFEKYYGNRSQTNAVSGKSERNGRAPLDRYHEEERERYNNLLGKLKEGSIVHRDELLSMAMLLRMTRAQADELLERCGEEPISARNLYEGALLMVWSFLSEVCPVWFGVSEKSAAPSGEGAFERFEEFISREYEAELDIGGPVDFQVMFSRQLDKALAPLPKAMEGLLREVPGWYLSPEKRALRMEKRRFSTIVSECAAQMCGVWSRAEERGAGNIDWSLSEAVNLRLQDSGFEELDAEREQKLLTQLDVIEALWLAAVAEGAPLKVDRDSVEQYCLKTLAELDGYYLKKYAPKKQKGGSGGGQKKTE